MNWLDTLNEDDLVALLPVEAIGLAPDAAAHIIGRELMQKKLLPRRNVTAASKKVAKKAAPSSDRKTHKKKPDLPRYMTIYEAVKAEFWTLVCSNDRKYSALRRKLEKSSSNLTLAAVGAISAAISTSITATIGVAIAAGVVAAFVASLLCAVVSIGANAFCGVVELPASVASRKRRAI